jgi:hypothetical protein
VAIPEDQRVRITCGGPVGAGVSQSVSQHRDTRNRMNVKPIVGGVPVSQSIPSLLVRRRITYGACGVKQYFCRKCRRATGTTGPLGHWLVTQRASMGYGGPVSSSQTGTRPVHTRTS